MEKIDKLKEQIMDLDNCLERLSEVLQDENDESDNYVRDSTILRFEVSYELSWKIMKEFSVFMGQEDCYSPKSCIRAAAQNGLIDNPEVWFKYLEYRNLVSHTYNQETAEQLYSSISAFLTDAKKLLSNVKAKTAKQ